MAENFKFNPITGRLDIVNAGADAGIGKQTIWVPAAAWSIPMTNGASLRTEEAPTDPEDSNEITTIDFVADDDTRIYCPIAFPKSIDYTKGIELTVFGKWRDDVNRTQFKVYYSLSTWTNQTIQTLSEIGSLGFYHGTDSSFAGKLDKGTIDCTFPSYLFDKSIANIYIERQATNINDVCTGSFDFLGALIEYETKAATDD